MKNIIVVTGGAGFVGANLIELLLKKTKFKIISFEPSYKILAMGISVELENNAEFFKLVESKSKSVTSPKQTQRQQK